DEKDQPFRTKAGYATIEMDSDEFGNVRAYRFFDEAGKPTRHKDGYFTTHSEVDPFGRIVEWTWQDETGKPVRSRLGNISVRRFYTGASDYIDEYLDEKGQPDKPDGTFVKYKVETIQSGSSGRTVKYSYLDESDHLVRDTNWVAGWVAVLDLDGR